jgi:GT2 family glycosyltransferase
MNSAAVHLYHIAYSQQTLETLRPGFRLLDNLSNPRPDWYESWPIRQFLLTQVLDEEAYYAFFSPKFFLKTVLDANYLRQFVASDQDHTDAFFICPQAEVGAVFLNPVMGSEFTDPGALATVQKSLDKAGLGLDIASQVIDSTTLVYSNYVIAKPAYWRRWLSMVECVYDIAENGSDQALQSELVHPTRYDGGVQRKVFLIECLPSLLFITDAMKVKSIPLNESSAARGVMYPYREQSLAWDAYKIAYNRTGNPAFLNLFHSAANAVLAHFMKPQTDTTSGRAGGEASAPVLPAARLVTTKPAVKPVVVVVATRFSEQEFHAQSATGKSLQLLKFPEVSLKLFAQNSTGLPALYNQVIEEYLDQDVILVFAHDDLHFLDLFWPERFYQGLSEFDLVGVVGNRMRHPMQPSWAFVDVQGTWDQKENLSGSIAHGDHFPPETFAEFGPTGAVKILDGLCLAASATVLKQSGLRFDERFNFHFYDLDFCRRAEELNLQAGTIPLSLIHESKGSFNNQSWLDAYKSYIAKWQG